MVDPITIDFETHGIVGNPLTNPPKPVGVAIWVPEQEPFYLAWGHPSGNNCSFAHAHEYLTKIIDSGRPVLFHNAGFDIAVQNHTFCNAIWPWINGGWKRVHDTMYLLFLADPYAPTFSLKPSADRWLGMAPSEQDELHQWILKNVPEATKSNAGAFISRAPAELVGRYAIGDVVRTRKLFDLLYARISEQGMLAAYEREQRLFPTMFEATRRGIKVDRDTLEWHTEVYGKCLDVATERLGTTLGISPAHVDEDEYLADALEKTGAVKEWVLTKTGKRSMAKENLHITNPEVQTLLAYRGALTTCLQTFMRPWLEKSAANGRLHPNWNQVKQARGARGDKGTRTGRLSSDDPNFQNVPTEFTLPNGDPLPVPEGLHPPPIMRSYIKPDDGHIWLKRDYSSQEIRILAHFEDGSLCEAYRANPNLDPHQMAKELALELLHLTVSRKTIKITGFSIIYGSGNGGLASQLGVPYDEAARIKSAYLTIFPGIKELMQDVQRRGRSGDPIRTWGGRLYFVEPSKEVNGRMMDFAYKLLNYLIQGSAADQTKEAICYWSDHKKWSDTFVATVHDEINISAPIEDKEGAMIRLRDAMNLDRLDVPVLSEGFAGFNWNDIEEYEP